ncbi:DivIVA domain-containing protein [Actinoplanes sp. NPDC049265]|uniref:DivIVA domain-containing protein n=1 Tax=Actinoplanes sp. NPDC049265 TaxID=3363902 RepID=UPI00371CEE47
MTSQGQRFRRRALRRGYKVDEVDSFLDRVEATLAGEQVGPPVGAQEVHDVVFRVRFGGYDEWQVDLHLDRVERQLAEFEERGGGRQPDPRMAPEPMRGNSGAMPVDRMGPSMGAAGMSRGAPPTERIQMPPQMPQRQQQQLPPSPEPTYGRGGYDEPSYGGQRGQMGPGGPGPGPGYDNSPQGQGPGYDRPGPGYDTGSFDSFEPGRHGKADMTAEIRMPERDRGGYGPSPMSGPPSPMSGPPMGGGGMGGPGMGGPPMGGDGGPNGELYRVDQLRRTFQPRRFGSGYDPMQVDRLFESILQAMSGRGPMPVPENELDTLQFGLVPGGYFEAEVDAALREVKDILLRRR